MSIKFVNLFQDTWNFVRNRPNFALYAIGLLTLLQVVISLLFKRPQLTPEQLSNPPALQQMLAEQVLPTFISALALVFVNVLLILNVKSINNGEYQHFFQNISGALQRFLQSAWLTLLQMLPLSVGMSFLLVLGKNDGSLLAIPLLVTGLYVFVKLNLVVYAYLIEPNQSLTATLKWTWSLSRGKMLPLIVYSALIYLIPAWIGSVVNGLGAALGSVAGAILVQTVNAFLNLLFVIFSFRFYQVYRDYRGA